MLSLKVDLLTITRPYLLLFTRVTGYLQSYLLCITQTQAHGLNNANNENGYNCFVFIIPTWGHDSQEQVEVDHSG